MNSSAASRLLMFILLALAQSLAAGQARVLKAEMFGSWTIARRIPTGSIAALTENEANALIGHSLTFGQTELDNGQSRFTVKKYHTRVMTAGQFLEENKVNLKKLVAQGDHITEVVAEAKERDIADQLGATVYLSQDHQVVIVYRGVYFALKRRER